MKVVSLLLGLAGICLAASLNDSWQFGPEPAMVSFPSRAGAGFYRRSFDIPRSAADKHVRLAIDAGVENLKVWLNGDLLATDTPFIFDLTPALKTGGINTVSMQLSDSGMVRSVSLLTTGRVFPVKQTVLATPQTISVSVMVRNTLDNTSGVQANFTVSIGGKVIGRGQTSATVPPNLTQRIEATIALRPEDVKLWDHDHPNLYQLRTVIAKFAEAMEGAYETEITSTFGIRTVEIRGTAFLLNGAPLRLGGAHQRTEPGEQELRSMKEAGMVFQIVDYPVSSGLLEWSDQNGLLLLADKIHDSSHPSLMPPLDFLLVPAGSSRTPGKPTFLDGLRNPGLLNDDPNVFGAAALSADPMWSKVFRVAAISQIFQKDGNTFVEIHNHEGFPSQTLRDYEVGVGPLTHKLPVMKPGETITLEFEHVNPYRVELRQPTGFIIDSR